MRPDRNFQSCLDALDGLQVRGPKLKPLDLLEPDEVSRSELMIQIERAEASNSRVW